MQTAFARRKYAGALLPLLGYLVLISAITSAAFHFCERRWVDFRRAEKLAAAGDFRAAAALYDRALAGGLDDPRLYRGLGRASLELQDFARARAAYERALQSEPQNLPAIENLAGIHQHFQEPEKAVALFESFTREGGVLTPYATLHLARLNRETRRWAAAEQLYRQLPESFPALPEAQRELAEMLAWQQRYDESITLLRQLVTAQPADRETRLALARALSWAGRLEEANTEYRILLQ